MEIHEQAGVVCRLCGKPIGYGQQNAYYGEGSTAIHASCADGAEVELLRSVVRRAQARAILRRIERRA